MPVRSRHTRTPWTNNEEVYTGREYMCVNTIMYPDELFVLWQVVICVSGICSTISDKDAIEAL